MLKIQKNNAMNIVILTHPPFLKSQSMPRYAKFIGDSLASKGHCITYLTAKAFFYNMPFPSFLKKWLGYIDQYIVFPIKVKKSIAKYPKDTLFVFADQALGPWVYLVKNRPHIIHCHDFLAQRSALGEIPENRTSWTGKTYQAYIRRGYRKGRNFISITHKTQQDLHSFLLKKPEISKVVYNTLTRKPINCTSKEARVWISSNIGVDVSAGYLLHIGGNQWYKNRLGVLEIYVAWRKLSGNNLPLIMMGAYPTDILKAKVNDSNCIKDVYWLSNVSDEMINYGYKGASTFLFPSLNEGFGWPIIEAMSNDCVVLTTDEEPMKEVAGDAVFYISRRYLLENSSEHWANESAKELERILNLSELELDRWKHKGKVNLTRFDACDKISEIENIYIKVLENNR